MAISRKRPAAAAQPLRAQEAVKKQRTSAGQAAPCRAEDKTGRHLRNQTTEVLRGERPVSVLAEGCREPPADGPRGLQGSNAESEEEFPIECRLEKDPLTGVCQLSGRCRTCGQEFLARGCIVGSTQKVLPFNTHSRVQAEMVQHARTAHGLKGSWSAARHMEQPDSAKRLVWTRSEGEEESPKPVEAPRNLRTTKVLRGERPILLLAEGYREPPAGLLPSDARIIWAPPSPSRRLEAVCYQSTLAAALAAGLLAPPAWQGLGELPDGLEGCFRSLLIVGPSGSGKSTLLRNLLAKLLPGEAVPLYPTAEWPRSEPIIEAFRSADEARDLLTGTGLSSVPTWCKPYEVLSVGERYRADVARGLQQRLEKHGRPLALDEWTSELDRTLAQALSTAFGKRLHREGLASPVSAETGANGQVAEAAARGHSAPYLFASCHEDIAAFLCPELICVCAQGVSPRLFRNPESETGPRLNIHAAILGTVSPHSVNGGDELLVGDWLADDEESKVYIDGWYRAPFSIRYKRPCKEPHTFRLSFRGGGVVQRLQPDKTCGDSDAIDPVHGWYTGCFQDGSQIRIRLVDESTLILQRRQEGEQASWAHIRQAQAARAAAPLPSAAQVEFLVKDPAVLKELRGCHDGKVLDYADCDEDRFRRFGWYLPPELAGTSDLYGGLPLAGPPRRVSSLGTFRWTARLETVEDEQRYLGMYVGLPDGAIQPKLVEASAILDYPFDGLCTHLLPKLGASDLEPFAVGVITGPSGSGKSTLTRELFGQPAEVCWASSTPVLGHFSSLARGQEACRAASLNPNVAMRPFAELSGGEQARARVARLLDAAAHGAPALQGRALILDEFASLVDRPTAKHMAAGVQAFAVRFGLRGVVVVSCHSDFVGPGMLEPDWLFECHNCRLVRFVTSMAPCVAPESPEPDGTAAASALPRAVPTPCTTPLRLLHSPEPSPEPCRHLREPDAVVLRAVPTPCTTASPVARCWDAQNTSAGMKGSATGGALPPPLELAPPREVLQVRRALPREWVHFRDHHYKDHSLKGDSVAFVGLLRGHAVAFSAVVPESFNFVRRGAINGAACGEGECGYPTPWASTEKHRQLFREHRTVVHPDCQGMGLAPLLCDAVAKLLHDRGADFTSQTVHPSYGSYRDRSPFWRALPSNGRGKFSHFFVGAVLPDGSTDSELQLALERRVRLE